MTQANEMPTCPDDCTEKPGTMFEEPAILFLRDEDGHCVGYRRPTDEEEQKRLALATLEEADFDEVEKASFGENTYEHGSGEFLVLTDDEADDAAREYISESVWAFRAEFLEHHTPEGVDADTIRILQEKCEGANAALKGMISDFDGFVEDAVSADGRGHFLNHYDGAEHEVGEFYIYRTN